MIFVIKGKILGTHSSGVQLKESTKESFGQGFEGNEDLGGLFC